MEIVILVIVGIIGYFLYKRNEQLTELKKEGGVLNKYNYIISNILSEDNRLEIVQEHTDYVVINLTTAGGSTTFTITQNIKLVTIEFVINSPLYGNHKLEWDFEEHTNQDRIIKKIRNDIENYQNGIIHLNSENKQVNSIVNTKKKTKNTISLAEHIFKSAEKHSNLINDYKELTPNGLINVIKFFTGEWSNIYDFSPFEGSLIENELNSLLINKIKSLGSNVDTVPLCIEFNLDSFDEDTYYDITSNLYSYFYEYDIEGKVSNNSVDEITKLRSILDEVLTEIKNDSRQWNSNKKDIYNCFRSFLKSDIITHEQYKVFIISQGEEGIFKYSRIISKIFNDKYDVYSIAEALSFILLFRDTSFENKTDKIIEFATSQPDCKIEKNDLYIIIKYANNTINN